MTSASEKGVRLFLMSLKVTDPTIKDEQITASISVLKGKPCPATPYEPIVKQQDAAKMFGRDRHTLAQWAKRGLLVAVRTGKGGKRITGYTASSVNALLAGKASEKEVA